jgi:hypothetical protein
VPFAFPLVLREEKDHLNVCYYCVTKIDDHNSKVTHNVVYPKFSSARRPVEHDDSLPILKPPQQLTVHEEEPTSTSPEDEPGSSCSIVDPDFPKLTVPHLVSQSELNDLARNINISKTQAEFLTSRLQEWKFLQQQNTLLLFQLMHTIIKSQEC